MPSHQDILELFVWPALLGLPLIFALAPVIITNPGITAWAIWTLGMGYIALLSGHLPEAAMKGELWQSLVYLVYALIAQGIGLIWARRKARERSNWGA